MIRLESNEINLKEKCNIIGYLFHSIIRHINIQEQLPINIQEQAEILSEFHQCWQHCF